VAKKSGQTTATERKKNAWVIVAVLPQPLPVTLCPLLGLLLATAKVISVASGN
jgi:pyrroline-5-carboxylate reductase